MTGSEQQHCGHECVCKFYVDIFPRPCQEPDRDLPCPHDTRRQAAPAAEPLFLVSAKELNEIKNDCAYPESESCVGCPLADGEDDSRASGMGCNFKGANALMDEVLTRPVAAQEQPDALALLDEWDHLNNRNFGKPHPVFHDMIRMVREKPEEVRKHLAALREWRGER